ncbi:MAG: hypothetical protein KDC07_02910 [Chitinophagaceae bacterium]|nr:hypothetical protein [Chitinophagaceae bacterium]
MKQLSYLLVISVLLFGCGSATKNTAETTDSAAVEEAQFNGEREPYDDEIHEYGMVKEVEDMGYPIFAVDMEFPERQMEASFNLNIEQGGIDHDAVYNMKGKYVTFYYTVNDEPDLADMQVNGKSLFGQYAPEKIDPDWKKITGTLSGANEPTPGDLPGKVTVTAKDGNAVTFRYFVDVAMVTANGKEVNAYYTMSGTQDITYIKVSED